MKNLLIFLFSFKGEVNRKQFLCIYPICLVLLFSVAWIISNNKNIGYFGDIANIMDLVLTPLAFVSLVSLFSFCWRRLENMGRGKFWIIFLMTPAWFLVLILLSIFPSNKNNK